MCYGLLAARDFDPRDLAGVLGMIARVFVWVFMWLSLPAWAVMSYIDPNPPPGWPAWSAVPVSSNSACYCPGGSSVASPGFTWRTDGMLVCYMETTPSSGLIYSSGAIANHCNPREGSNFSQIWSASYSCPTGTILDTSNGVRCKKDCPVGRELVADGSCLCPSDKDEVNGVCVPQCSTSEIRNAQGICVPHNPCVDGQATDQGFYETKTGLTTKQYCDGQCMVNLDFDNNGSCYYLIGNSGPAACRYWRVRTSTQCSTNTLPAAAAPHKDVPDEPKPPCPQGQQQIGTNAKGDAICARVTGEPKTSSETTNTGSPVTNPDGSTSQTETKTQTGPNGEETTTTTTTTTNPDGSSSSTRTVTSNGMGSGNGLGDDFCEQHPDSIICQTQDFYGDCESSFECKGDPLLCAISKEQHLRNCALFEKENSYSQLGSPGLEVDPGFEQKMGQALNLDGSGDWDLGQMFNNARQDYVNFSGSCPIPQSITVKGFTVALPQDDLCAIGRLIRLLMHAFGYLTVLSILSRGIV